MLPFWIIHILIWSGVVIYGATGTWAMLSARNVRRGDPMRLACFLIGLVTVGFTLRWLLAPGSTLVWQTLYILSCATALYILKLMRVYGRGGPLA